MGYDSSRMSCLLVEDKKFMRGVLCIVMESGRGGAGTIILRRTLKKRSIFFRYVQAR